jgi:3-oxoadipate enol-lactonase
VRGHGRTEKPSAKYSLKQFADDAALLLEHLHLGPVQVMGLSMGGMIAFQLAADRPDLVRSMIIVNSGPEMVLRTWKEKLGIVQRRLIVRLMGMRKMGVVLAERLIPAPEYAARRQTFAERWAQNDKAAYLRALSALVGWSVKARLPAITCPVLVVTADMDYSSVDLKREYTALMPNATLTVIPDSRHMMPVERPDAFHAAIIPFLTAHAAPT